jgi:hypothetical protein
VIVVAASELPRHFPDGTVPSLGRAHPRVPLSRRALLCLNAHLFLGTAGPTATRPRLPCGARGFLRLMGGVRHAVAAERLACHLSYFAAAMHGGRRSDGAAEVVFEAVEGSAERVFKAIDDAADLRLVVAVFHFFFSSIFRFFFCSILFFSHFVFLFSYHSGIPLTSSPAVPLPEIEVSVDVRIEDAPDCIAHVDFANRDLQIGCVIPSCTQEEVLFSIRPELMPGILFAERMDGATAIVMSGAQRYAAYSGYLDSFRLTGAVDPLGEPVVPLVLAVDAIVAHEVNQFEETWIRRDTAKAAIGFRACADAVQDAPA